MPENCGSTTGVNAANSKSFLTECKTTEDQRHVLSVMSHATERESDTESVCDASKAPEEAWDTDLEIDDETKDYNMSGAKIYLQTCQLLNVVPVSYFCRHVNDEEVIMRHHGLGPQGAKAIAVPLLTNTNIISLDLSDNWLEAQGAMYIADMLKDNCYITHLTIADNKIASEGATAICDMLHSNTTLTYVNLSGNGFTDKDGEKFARALLKTTTLRELILSHNHLGIGCSPVLGHAIGENESLEALDLSWNQIRGKACQDIFNGITVNSRLKRVNLSWNGLGDAGTIAMAECIKQNQIISHMDITNNRITPAAIPALVKALDINETLLSLKIGQNAIGANGALMLLNSINNERNILEVLDLTDVCVDMEFDRIHKDIIQRRAIRIQHGGVLGVAGPKQRKKKKHELGPEERAALKALEDFLQNDPMARLQDHVETKHLRLVDLFKDLDKNKDFKIGPDDLKRKVKSTGIDMSDEKIDRLIEKMDKDSNGLIDYRDFVPLDQH